MENKSYEELLKENERFRKALEEISNMEIIDYFNSNTDLGVDGATARMCGAMSGIAKSALGLWDI